MVTQWGSCAVGWCIVCVCTVIPKCLPHTLSLWEGGSWDETFATVCMYILLMSGSTNWPVITHIEGTAAGSICTMFNESNLLVLYVNACGASYSGTTLFVLDGTFEWAWCKGFSYWTRGMRTNEALVEYELSVTTCTGRNAVCHHHQHGAAY